LKNFIRAIALGALMVSLTNAARSAEGAASTLRIVADKENLPYSSERQHPPGLDVEIALELAKAMGATLAIEWIDTLDEGLLKPVLDPETGIHAAVGVAIESRTVEDAAPVGEEALFSLPYAAARYVLVTRREFRDLNSIEETGRVALGVEAGSVAAVELWNAGFMTRHFGSQERILEALVEGSLDFGVLWNNAGWMMSQNERWREAVKMQVMPWGVPGIEWNLGVAVGRHNRELLPAIDGAILKLKKEGTFKRLFEKYSMPYFEPIAAKEKAEP
jgi:ABC-type amino acid transport substrate-binding protein